MRILVLIMFVALYSIRPTNLYAFELRVDCDGGITYDTCAESDPNGTYFGGCPVLNASIRGEKCTKGSTRWIHGVGYYSCDECVSGGALHTKTDTAPGNCTVYYNYCECAQTATCNSGPWTSIRAGYESRLQSTALCNSCKNTTEYRCSAGYWGKTTNGTSGCTKCETNTTSAAGSDSHSACCYPDGYSYTGSDSTGNYTITNNGKCCWS